jgi:tetratricopeptide (TPR) repeat protein
MTGQLITPIAAAAMLLAACGAGPTGSTGEATAGDGDASIERGEQLVEQGAYEEAAALFEQIVEQSPGDAKGHYYLGWCRENLGDPEAAIEQYRLAIGYDGNLAEAHNNLGNLLLVKGDLVHAEAELHTYLKQRPDESAAYYNYGLVLEAMGRLSEAREQYDRAIELDPEDPAPVIGVADLELEAGKLEQALELYRTAGGLDAENPLPTLKQGQVLLELKRLDEAVTALVKLAEMPAADAPMLTTAGILLGRYDEADRAIDLYRAALKRDEGYALAHFKLANALGRKQEFAPAAKHFERFLELAPDAAEAEAAQKGLAACRAKTGG